MPLHAHFERSSGTAEATEANMRSPRIRESIYACSEGDQSPFFSAPEKLTALLHSILCFLHGALDDGARRVYAQVRSATRDGTPTGLALWAKMAETSDDRIIYSVPTI